MDEAPQTSSPASEPQAATVDDLSTLLSQFETETAPKEEQPASQQQPAQQPPASPNNPATETLRAVIAQDTATQRQEVSQLGGALQAFAHQQRVQQDQADFEKVLSKADAMLRDSGLAVGEDFSQRWLIAEAQLNAALLHAFDNRNSSPEMQRQYQKLERKAMEKLLKAAKQQPDREATLDRAAVIAAMRGSSGVEPQAPPKNYGAMNDTDFRSELKKYGL